MAPYGSGRAHPIHASEDAADRVRAFYGERTDERLRAVKDRWGPQNVFAASQNLAVATRHAVAPHRHSRVTPRRLGRRNGGH